MTLLFLDFIIPRKNNDYIDPWLYYSIHSLRAMQAGFIYNWEIRSKIALLSHFYIIGKIVLVNEQGIFFTI